MTRHHAVSRHPRHCNGSACGTVPSGLHLEAIGELIALGEQEGFGITLRPDPAGWIVGYLRGPGGGDLLTGFSGWRPSPRRIGSPGWQGRPRKSSEDRERVWAPRLEVLAGCCELSAEQDSGCEARPPTHSN